MEKKLITALYIIVALVIFIILVHCTQQKRDSALVSDSSFSSKQQLITSDEYANLQDLNLSPQKYVDLYDSWSYHHVTAFDKPPLITYNKQVDLYIQKLAISKGYKLRYEANESMLEHIGNLRLQPEVLHAWKKMKSAAASEGIHLDLISGYRSIAKQRSIFLNNFGTDFTNAQILKGHADEQLHLILTTRSIPGYSKHHTGYTIDITDRSIGYDFTKFKQTSGYEWISKNNFENARKFGFIPSYPEGVEGFGPAPEAWEYVWIGDTVPMKILQEIGFDSSIVIDN